MLALQGSAGNAAVVQMLRQAGGAPAHESGCGHCAPGSQVQRSVAGAEQEEHAHGTGHEHGAVADTSPEGQSALLAAARESPSESLPASVVAKAEPFFQNPKLSSTRVHRDAVAQRATAALGAQAMTVGNHIFLSAKAVGDEATLGHELSHVDKNTRNIAETGRDNGAGVTVTHPDQGSERGAEIDGAAYAAGEKTAPSVTAQRSVGQPVQRSPKTVEEEEEELTADGRAVQRAVHEEGGAEQTVQRAGGHGTSSRHGGHSGGSSTRRRLIPVTSLPHAYYLRRPHYDPPRRRGGGTYTTVTLGPYGFSDRRSDADSHLPPAIDDARHQYPNETFKAGHLINASFGGDGRDSANLTILTTRANNLMRGFDDPIKHAVGHVASIYETLSAMYEDIRLLELGVKVTVTPAGENHTWETEGPGKYISSYIACRAKVVGASALERWIDQALANDPSDPNWRYIKSELALVDHYVDSANLSDLIDNDATYPFAPYKKPRRR
ncbi:DUF4157 domain-containing protein [Streptomyces sp. NPDC021093]|uniref:DUF4157 domain-containing protein n=1 Tax=Streptomyces sp. NPDC021093 TaxID=3365112 RepID=UPI0037A2940F